MPFALIALIALGFCWWWPVGLVILLFFLGSRRMGCWHRHAMGGYGHPMGDWKSGDWQSGQTHWQAKVERLQAKMDRARAKMDNLGRGDWWGSPPSSGNRAFDDYRRDTMRRLEDEQREFKEFLERLRFAKDRQEFDQFMADRQNHPTGAGSTPPAA
jgi:hypothetical protein